LWNKSERKFEEIINEDNDENEKDEVASVV